MGIDFITLALANSNKLAYTEGGFTEKKEVINTTCEFNVDGDFYGYNFETTPFLKKDSYYRVYINDKIIDCICLETITESSIQLLYLGNINILLGDYTNIEDGDFVLLNEPNSIHNSEIHVLAIKNSQLIVKNCVLKIYELEGSPEIVHKIDPKYYERLAWEDTETGLLYNFNLFFNEGNALINVPLLKENINYTIEIDGISYDLTAKLFTYAEEGYNSISVVYVGNIGLFTELQEDLTSEPFLLFTANGMSMLVMVENYDINNLELATLFTGNKNVKIYGERKSIKKIDEKFMPDSVSMSPDYNQNNNKEKNFIKNRPCYNGFATYDLLEISNNNNCVVLNTGFYLYLKIDEYIPFDDNFYNIKYGDIDFSTCTIKEIDENGNWCLHNIDSVFVYGICDKDNADYEFPETGLYVLVVDMSEKYQYFYLPQYKQLDKSLYSINWDDIKDRPFGEIVEQTFELSNNIEWNYNTIQVYDGAFYHKKLHRHFNYEDFVGAIVKLSNGEVITINENDLLLSKTDSANLYVLIIGNYLACILNSNDIPSYVSVNNEHYIPLDFGKDIGLYSYLNDASGIYAKSITIPSKIKQFHVASSEIVGGIFANKTSDSDVQEVKISDDGYLYTTPLAYETNKVMELEVETKEECEYVFDTIEELLGATVTVTKENIVRLKNEISVEEISIEKGTEIVVFDASNSPNYSSNTRTVLIVYNENGSLQILIDFNEMLYFNGITSSSLAYTSESLESEGIKLNKGWSIFKDDGTFESIDINEFPICYLKDELLNYWNKEYIDLFPILFNDEKSYQIIVKEENIIYDDTKAYVFRNNRLNYIRDEIQISDLFCVFLSEFNIINNETVQISTTSTLCPNSVKIEKNVIKKIDAKFLPTEYSPEIEIDENELDLMLQEVFS